MKTFKHHLVWIGLIVLIVLIAFTAFQTMETPWDNSASASSPELTAATPSQLAAIQGAQQLLLLQPINNPTIYLPMITR